MEQFENITTIYDIERIAHNNADLLWKCSRFLTEKGKARRDAYDAIEESAMFADNFSELANNLEEAISKERAEVKKDLKAFKKNIVMPLL